MTLSSKLCFPIHLLDIIPTIHLMIIYSSDEYSSDDASKDISEGDENACACIFSPTEHLMGAWEYNQ